MESAFRTVRIMHLALLTAAVVYTILPEMVHVHTMSVNPVVIYALFGVAFLIAIIALSVRARMVNRSAAQLATSPADTAALGRWRTGNITIFALSEAIVLYGLVLRFLGASLLQAGALYAAGIALLLLFTPRQPA